jgi:hypothetical protein
MSQTKRALDDAAELLDVPVDELTEWIMHGDYRPMPPSGAIAAPVTATVYRAASDLNVHPHSLDRWLRDRSRNAGPYAAVPTVDGGGVSDGLDERVAAQTAADGRPREVVRDANGRPLAILVHRAAVGGTASTVVTPAAELVSEDDYRGVAADLIARWADDHVDAATVLASLNLAAHGMPVTTPSRRALAKIREVADRALAGDDPYAQEIIDILDEVGA